jgi:hypothetical protein
MKNGLHPPVAKKTLCNADPKEKAHIIFGCTNAQQFWNAVGITTNEDWPIARLKEIQCPDHFP